MASNEIYMRDAETGSWRSFSDVIEVLEIHRLSEVLPALERIDHATRSGLYAAGFIAYEAAPAFDSALRVRPPRNVPLLWFALSRRADFRPPPSRPGSNATPGSWRSEISPDAYREGLRKIRAAIFRGDTYQVNYTFRLQAPFSGDP
ncbi:MAG: aminodeoxychorismate synthase, component I, partial [Kiritimatiellia bacterium]|nr:aminodeoxychorismate synthase, component I [Kiritimatiellia bacterium]